MSSYSKVANWKKKQGILTGIERLWFGNHPFDHVFLARGLKVELFKQYTP